MKLYVKSSSEEPVVTFDELCGNYHLPKPGPETRNSKSYKSAYQNAYDIISVDRLGSELIDASSDLLYVISTLNYYIDEKAKLDAFDEEDEFVDKQIAKYSNIVDQAYEKYMGIIEAIIDKINEEGRSLGPNSYKCQSHKENLIHMFRQYLVNDEVQMIMTSPQYYRFPN